MRFQDVRLTVAGERAQALAECDALEQDMDYYKGKMQWSGFWQMVAVTAALEALTIGVASVAAARLMQATRAAEAAGHANAVSRAATLARGVERGSEAGVLARTAYGVARVGGFSGRSAPGLVAGTVTAETAIAGLLARVFANALVGGSVQVTRAIGGDGFSVKALALGIAIGIVGRPNPGGSSAALNAARSASHGSLQVAGRELNLLRLLQRAFRNTPEVLGGPAALRSFQGGVSLTRPLAAAYNSLETAMAAQSGPPAGDALDADWHLLAEALTGAGWLTNLNGFVDRAATEIYTSALTAWNTQESELLRQARQYDFTSDFSFIARHSRSATAYQESAAQYMIRSAKWDHWSNVTNTLIMLQLARRELERDLTNAPKRPAGQVEDMGGPGFTVNEGGGRRSYHPPGAGGRIPE